jgi:hypothetical protein
VPKEPFVTTAAITLLTPRAVSEAFKDPCRHTWDFPVANLPGYRFLFNETCVVLPSFVGEEALIETLVSEAGEDESIWAHNEDWCEVCSGKLVPIGGELDTTRLTNMQVRVRLEYDNLRAMYSPDGVVKVSFRGEFLCAGCHHPNQFNVNTDLPISHILGVIHAREEAS